MKKIISFIAAILILSLMLCGCGKTDTSEKNTGAGRGETQSAVNPADNDNLSAGQKDVLVVVFSVTGNTKTVAQKIAALTDADFYEIKAAEPYSSDDIDYSNKNSRTTKEQNDKSIRPSIGSEDIQLEGYKTVYIGYPIWWGEEPRILDTFVEKYSFDGITCIPFCTSGSSGIGNSGKNLEKNAGAGIWKDGMRFAADATDNELQEWIDSIR